MEGGTAEVKRRPRSISMLHAFDLNLDKKKKKIQHAVDAALDLPPLADQHPTTLRLLAALAALSDAVYTATVADVGRELPIELLSGGSSSAATARLLHFRPAGGHGSSHRHDRRHDRSPLDDLGSDDDDDPFAAAADRVAGAAAALPTATALALYGLYKQATAGDVAGGRPPLWDGRGRAKW